MAFVVKTEKEICAIYHVTPEQLDKASRVIDMATGKIFYQVESQSEPGKIYEVRYNSEYKRLSCTCKAGQEGFGCWHRRASLAAAYEYRQEENIQARVEAGDKEAAEAARLARMANEYEKMLRTLEEQREEAMRCLQEYPSSNPFHILK